MVSGYLGVRVFGNKPEYLNTQTTIRVLKNKYRAVSQGARRWGKRSILASM